jgi:hypothetical protein
LNTFHATETTLAPKFAIAMVLPELQLKSALLSATGWHDGEH